MKLMASGVMRCAAMVRSPSFSRSSSSTTMIISPVRMALIASSMGAKGDLRRGRLMAMGLLRAARTGRAGGELDRAGDVFAEDVTFQVDELAGPGAVQVRVRP